jgi:hypothetical protein
MVKLLFNKKDYVSRYGLDDAQLKLGVFSGIEPSKSFMKVQNRS